MFFKIVLSIIIFFIGLFLAGFLTIVPLCCFNTGLPFTNQVQHDIGINMQLARNAYYRCLAIWFIFDVVLILLLFRFVPNLYVYFFIGGMFWTTIAQFKKTTINRDNLIDSIKFIRRRLSDHDLMLFNNYINKNYSELFSE